MIKGEREMGLTEEVGDAIRRLSQRRGGRARLNRLDLGGVEFEADCPGYTYIISATPIY